MLSHPHVNLYIRSITKDAGEIVGSLLDLLLNLVLQRRLAHVIHLAPPALNVLTGCQNILQLQIDLLEALKNDILPAAASSAASSSLLCR